MSVSFAARSHDGARKTVIILQGNEGPHSRRRRHLLVKLAAAALAPYFCACAIWRGHETREWTTRRRRRRETWSKLAQPSLPAVASVDPPCCRPIISLVSMASLKQLRIGHVLAAPRKLLFSGSKPRRVVVLAFGVSRNRVMFTAAGVLDEGEQRRGEERRGEPLWPQSPIWLLHGMA